MNLLSLLERVAPRVRLYPRWAQRLFAITLGCVLASVGVFTVVSPSAERHRAEAALLHGVSLDVGVDSVKAHRDRAIPAADLKTGTSAFDAPLTYETDRVGAGLVVTPRMEYLELLERGGPLPPVRYYNWWDAAATYPALDVKLLNETPRTVYVTSADVVVDSSVPDPRPVPVVHPGTDASPRAFDLANEGAPMRRLRVTFDLAPSAVQPRWRARYPHSVTVGRVADFGFVSLARALRDEGVDVAALTRIEASAQRRPGGLLRLTAAERASLARAAGPFDPGKPFLVYGTMTYASRSPAGGTQVRTVRFSSSAYLVQRRFGQGSAYEPTGYYNVRLRTSGAGYARVVPGVSQAVRPGGVDRFQIALAADASSHHRLRLRIRFNGADPVLSPPVDLRMFVPRSVPRLDEPRPIKSRTS